LLAGLAPSRQTAHGLFIGAGILTVSPGFRKLDRPVRDLIPVGTHFVWHILNGIMPGWMIDVCRRHRPAG